MTGIAAAAAPVVAVVGLAAEARIAAGAGVRTVAGGGDAVALALALEREVAAGACAIMSFGMAGALVPGLRPGTLVLASGVSFGPDRYAADSRWAARLRHSLPGATVGELTGSDRIVVDARGKAELRSRSGALAVDMETHIAARIAARHGLPFAALRAVADPAERDVPAAARVAMRAGGGIDVLGVLWSLSRAPGQLPGLLGIAGDARTALGALARSRRLLGDRLGYTDLDELSLHMI